MRRIHGGVLGALTLFICMAAAMPALGAEARPPQNMITMNFQNVDIPVLAKFISEITGRNFIIDESVRGKVSIISPTKVTPEQAYQIFQSVLQIKGFTTVNAGKVIKIVPSRIVRQSAQITTSQTPFQERGDEYVTRMVKLRNVDASSIVSVIQPMVSHDGLVAAFPEDNTLIITDDAPNVGRLLKIVGSLDVEGVHQNVEVIHLTNAFADDLAPEVEQILGEGSGRPGGPRPIQQGVVAPTAQGSATGFKVIPDERTNSVIAVAGPIQMKQIREIVTKLDINPPDAMSRIHVFHLKYASAPEMIMVLNGLLGGGAGPGSLSPTTGRGSLGRGSSLGLYGGSSFGSGFGMGGGGMGMGGMGMGGMGGGMGMGGMMGGMGGGMGMGGMGGGGMMRRSSAGGMGGPGGAGAASASSSGKTAEFANPVNVTADPATNSLVISAAPQDYQTLSTIISQLDVPRVQVFVQAIIVEVSAERQRNMGVEFQSSTALSGSTLGIGQLNFGQLQSALGNPLGLTGLGLGLASGSLCTVPAAAASAASTATGGGTMQVPCDVALMEALEVDSHSNVLSAPTLLTADNEEAMIVVGQNLPFVGSAAANAGLPGQIFNSVERQNVGITLDIVPQVSEGDYVRLDLYEEVSNVLNNTTNNPLGPTTTIRSASTTVLVQNHRTAVIGGLLSNNDDYQRQGIPWVSDIPVLGNLFSGTSSDKRKDNLLVFLTPHVVRTKNDLRTLALDQRQKYVRNLGGKEMHNMPASSVRELYNPTFSVAVPPDADLKQQYNTGPAAPSPMLPPTGDKATPFNTEEIGPSSSRGASGRAPVASASPAAPSAPSFAPAPAVVPPPPVASAASAASAPASADPAPAPVSAAREADAYSYTAPDASASAAKPASTTPPSD